MKKSCLTLLVIIIVSLCNAQTINFPDANFKARLLAAAPGLQIASGTAGIPGNPFVKIDANNDGEIEVSEALAITNLWLYNANITNISGLENFVNLREINCYGNSIATMNLSPLTQLTRITISGNHITTLNVTGLSNVEWLNCQFNELTSLDLTGMTNMYQLQCQNNQLTNLNISNASDLLTVFCQNNLLTNFSTENIDTLYNLNCSSNNLIQLSLKNNYAEINLNFSANPNLQYICADSSELSSVQSKINQYGYTNCYTNSNCDFILGNPVYFIEGIAIYDELNDGCDNTDIPYPNLTIALSNGINTGNVYSNTEGEFNTASQSTSVTITPQLINPVYFNISPSSQTLALTNISSPLIQNFCVTPNGAHPDLEIIISGGSNGFDSSNYYYTLTYKNKGTQTQSGDISMTFNDVQQDFVTATPTQVTSALNSLSWAYSDLKPFESRTILVQFLMNFEGANPPLLDGDPLNYSAVISSALTEETPTDNLFNYNVIYTSAVLSNNTNLSFSNYFTLYPNPVIDILNIKIKNDALVNSAIIYNLLGQSVYQNKNITGDLEIDVSDLKTGTYVIKMFSDKGIFYSRFIKK